MEGRLPRAIDAALAIPPPPVHFLLGAVDRARRLAITAAAPWARALLVDRERRVAFAGTALIAAAFVASCAFPLWMVALGPIIWGVPHILSDIRYLIMRQGYHRRPGILLAIGGGAAAAGLGYGVRGGLAAAAVALLFSRGTVARRAVAFGVIAVFFGIAQWAGFIADVVFAHLHNVVAVALWWAWRPRDTKLHYLPLLAFGVCGAALAVGVAEPLLRLTGGLSAPWTGLSLAQVAYVLSPSPYGTMATRLVLRYAFGQAVHYIVWLRLIPEEDRRSHTPRSYQQTYRALRVDVGSWVLWLALLGTVVFIVWALVESAGVARAKYLNIAFFHGYLELAAAALLWSEGRLPDHTKSDANAIATGSAPVPVPVPASENAG
jgi:hypothetical protein